MPDIPVARQRRADAVRNDERVLDAAREVFAEHGYRAKMTAIAERAGVGIGTLYQRFHSKHMLITEMNIAGMRRIIAEAETALASAADPWDAFAGFMRNCVEAGAGALLGLAGLAPPEPAQMRTAERLHEAMDAIVSRAARAGALRPGITSADIYLLFAQLRAEPSHDPQRARELRNRYLTVILDGLRPTAPGPLPGRPARWDELRRRWQHTPPSRDN